MFIACAVPVCGSLLLNARPAPAQVTETDVQIAGRALGFLKEPLTGEVSVGIVYARSTPQSVEDAASVQKLLGSGLKVGNAMLKPVLVAVSDADRANVVLHFLMPGLGAEAGVLTQTNSARRVPCITTDLAQVRSHWPPASTRRPSQSTTARWSSFSASR